MDRAWPRVETDGRRKPSRDEIPDRVPGSMLPSLGGEECRDRDLRWVRLTAPRRAASRRCPLCSLTRPSGWIDSFFFARQRPLQAAPVHLDVEACLDRVETLRSRRLGACSFEIDHEGNDFGRYLVAALGTAPARQQTGEPSRLQRALGLVKRWPGDAEPRGGFADCNAVDLVAPHHLVTHLDQVLRIEEWIAG